MIKLIVAIGKDGLIGSKDKLAWHLPEEFKHFKETTNTHSMLFGKTTYLGIGKKLPNRETIVLSTEDIPGPDRIIHNEDELNELFKEFKETNKILFICGGKFVYEKYFKFADEIIISEVEVEANGDVYLKMDLSDYRLTNEVQKTGFKIKFYHKKVNL